MFVKKTCINKTFSWSPFRTNLFLRSFALPRACCSDMIPGSLLIDPVLLIQLLPSFFTSHSAFVLQQTRFTSTFISLEPVFEIWKWLFVVSKNGRAKFFCFLIRVINLWAQSSPPRVMNFERMYLLVFWHHYCHSSRSSKMHRVTRGLWMVFIRSLCSTGITLHKPVRRVFCVRNCLLWDFQENNRTIRSGWMTGRLTKILLCVIRRRWKMWPGWPGVDMKKEAVSIWDM